MNSVRSNNLNLKYQRFTQSGYEDIGIRKAERFGKDSISLCSDFKKLENESKHDRDVYV